LEGITVNLWGHVQEHLSVGFPVDLLLDRVETPTNLGEEGKKWAYQANH